MKRSVEQARFIVPFAAIRMRYGKEGKGICEAIEALGPTLDVSRISANKLRARIWELPEKSICLVGGYELIPSFVRDNPTGPRVPAFAHYGDTDQTIPTDSPYGADPSDRAGELVPAKAISRIPDGAPLDGAGFLKTLRWQEQAIELATLPGSFEAASDDLARPAREVSAVLRDHGGSGEVSLSPRDGDITAPDLAARISGRGRVHLLLHGGDRAPGWSTLYGREAPARARRISRAGTAHRSGSSKQDPATEAGTRALSAALIDLCDLRGAMVALTSCYGAMLDDGDGKTAARSAADQVALACLGHGAKAIFGATRSNWIELHGALGFGPSLTAHLWTRLGQGYCAAEALRQAKGDLYEEMSRGARSDVGFAVKTLLQAHCFGHPLARLS